MTAKYYCGACKKQLANFGAMGNHVRYNPECTFERRFWGRVNKATPTGCWEYDGATDEWGYKHIAIARKRIQAHRWSYEQANGPIPAGKIILHSCDNPACVNPSHMRVGTDADNHADMQARGRANYATRAKLKPEDVLAIRAAFKERGDRGSQKELADKYGVDPATIWHVVQRKSWPNL